MDDIDAVILAQEEAWNTKARWFAAGMGCMAIVVVVLLAGWFIVNMLALFVLG